MYPEIGSKNVLKQIFIKEMAPAISFYLQNRGRLNITFTHLMYDMDK